VLGLLVDYVPLVNGSANDLRDDNCSYNHREIIVINYVYIAILQCVIMQPLYFSASSSNKYYLYLFKGIYV